MNRSYNLPRGGFGGTSYGGIGSRLQQPFGPYGMPGAMPGFDPMSGMGPGMGGPIPPGGIRGADAALDRNISLSGIGDRIKGGVGKVVGWAQDNPELALGIVGTGAEVYGAYQQGKQQDREFELTEQEIARRRDEDERRRRGREAAAVRIQQRRGV